MIRILYFTLFLALGYACSIPPKENTERQEIIEQGDYLDTDCPNHQEIARQQKPSA